jgi:uncharacterized protein (TIGR03066 family)
MKKYLFLMMLMLVGACTTFMLSSCGDDDDDNEFAYSQILGSWQADDADDGILVVTFGKNGNGSIEVNNGNYSISSSFTYAFDGHTLIVSGEEDGETYSDTYVVTFYGNVMTLTGQDEDGETFTETFTRVN